MFRDHWCESFWRVARVQIVFILLCVFDDFGERHSSCIWFWFCICFVKMHLTIVGGCQKFVLVCFTFFLFIISGSWKNQTEADVVFYISFIDVLRQLMWEFVEGCQCSNFVYCIMCVSWFRWTSQFIEFMFVLYMFCENAFDRCWRMSNVRFCFVLQCVVYDFGVLKGPNGSILCILY